MWSQACSQAYDEMCCQSTGKVKRAALLILPCTVSQLLAAHQVSRHNFTICEWELNQVSIVGIIRAVAPFVTNIQFSVDDMTGPPLTVRQWVNTEDCALMTSASPGTYVKVTGSLHSFNGQRSLLAMNIRCIEDLNEITSHMLEVVRAHMHLSGKDFDVNMNTTAASPSGCSSKDRSSVGLTTVQQQVLQVLMRFSNSDTGISFHELQTQLDYLSTRDIRTSLTFLINEGHAFCTTDENHFKSTEC